MEREPNPAARVIAPAALALGFILAAIVVGASLAGSDADPERRGGGSQRQERQQAGGEESGTSRERHYVVKPGDTLEQISDETGVPVERIIALNPDVDPQALVSGQRLRLR